ncbi:hypothetical protein HC928_16175 [bacterium]|nr:hypothetical protein [bacterium]
MTGTAYGGAESAAVHDPLATLAALLARRSSTDAPEMPYTSYQPFGWQPARAGVDAIFAVERPRIERGSTPSAVLDWLPRPLSAPQEATPALAAIARALDLPGVAPLDHVDAALTAALPAPPALPPVDGEDWLTRWFSDDTLGIRDTFADLWPALPLPEVPTYQITMP